jgi:hypothetical protein
MLSASALGPVLALEPGARYELPGLSHPVVRGVQGVLGFNKLAGWIGAKAIEKEIHKKVSGDIDVHLEPYSGLDLTTGKAKHLRIKGHDLLYDKAFYVSDFLLRTRRETPLWINLDTGKLQRAVDADIELRLTDSDFNRSFQTKEVQRILGNIKVSLLGGEPQRIQVLEPAIAFSEGKLHFQAQLGLVGGPSVSKIPLNVSTGLAYDPKTELIQLQDLQLAPLPGVSDNTGIQALVTQALQKYLKPSKLVPLKGGKFNLNDVAVVDNAVSLRGQVTLYPPSSTSSTRVSVR